MTSTTGNIASGLSFDDLEFVAYPPEGTPSFESLAQFDGIEKYPEIRASQKGDFGPSLTFVVSLYTLELSIGKVAAVIVDTGMDDGPEDLLDMDMLRVFKIEDLENAKDFYSTCIRDFESNWANIIG